MSDRDKETPNENVTIRAKKIRADRGGTVGVDTSKGKKITSIVTDGAGPLAFLKMALTGFPLAWWAVGVGAILAVVAIAASFRVPAGGLVIGGIGLFFGMFGLVIFAGLVKPPVKGVKPPVVSQVVLWAFGVLLIAVGFLSASSVFFDWPIALRSEMFTSART